MLFLELRKTWKSSAVVLSAFSERFHPDIVFRPWWTLDLRIRMLWIAVPSVRNGFLYVNVTQPPTPESLFSESTSSRFSPFVRWRLDCRMETTWRVYSVSAFHFCFLCLMYFYFALNDTDVNKLLTRDVAFLVLSFFYYGQIALSIATIKQSSIFIWAFACLCLYFTSLKSIL